ncbi:MAG: hypothetical protein HY302_08160 [Opitutae bacterium]|nr:hypothetical protein [Opitutae bacterium]
MDDQLQELETELKSLRPRRPSALLARRIGRELAAEVMPPPAPAPRDEPRPALRGPWSWAPLAAAAAVALLATVGVLRLRNSPSVAPAAPLALAAPQASAAASPAPETASAARDLYRPVLASNVLYDMKDEGVVYLADRTPARQTRYRYLDTYTWKNPRTNASLKWSMPRDEVRVQPASFTLN